MSRIVSQLLIVARLEATGIPLDQPVDLREVAMEAAVSLGPIAIAGGRSIELEQESDEAIFVRGNDWVILNAVRNLVENALGHTPPGTAVVIRLTDEPAIHVIDHGHGVPPALRDRIFERFWSGDSGTSGAGLGLSIVRRIMQAVGGTVTVSDAMGGGAVFSLLFPPLSA